MMRIIRSGLALLLLLLWLQQAGAQTHIGNTVTGTLTDGIYYNETSIRLNPPFSYTAGQGQGLRLMIISPDSGCMILSSTPSANQNYIRVRQPRVPITTVGGLEGRTNCELQELVQYFDGQGRPLQTVQVRGSASGKDVIQPFAYDAYGREVLKYMPYTLTASTPGSYQSTALDGGTGYTSSGQYAFYQVAGQGYVNTIKPLAGVNFEPSPLNRPVEQGAPGTDWQLGGGHTVRIEYGVNNQNAFTTTPIINNPGSKKVALYTATINSNFTRTLTRTGNTATYNNSTLSLTITKDENWKSGADSCLGTTEEYKDLAGQTVLRRTYNLKNGVIEMLSTYYVYDKAGNLCFVLPPDVTPDTNIAITQTQLDNYCYQYRFDERNRPTQKKLPGKGWEYFVYNLLDKQVATQDSLQRAAGQWIFIKYDNFGRVVMTGIWAGTIGLSRTSLQGTINATTTYWETATGTGTGYTTAAWPTSAITPLTINYYDKYTNIPSLPSAYSAPTGATTNTQGLLVGTKVAILNTPSNMLLTVPYFDQFGRTIKTYTQHYLGGVLSNNNYDAQTTTFDFCNHVTTTKRQHYNTTHTATPLVTIDNSYSYDHMGRRFKSWGKITNGTTATTRVLLSKVDYNEIEQVFTRHLHSTDSTNFQQNVTYAYNERGWLLTINAPLFAMQLYYNTGTNKSFNGNVMYQYWGTPGSLTMNYTYLYDRLNRLMSGASSDHFIERGIAYDTQGNITNLSRVWNNSLSDSLVYSYTGNRLVSITDKTTSATGLVAGTTNYFYDGNNNLLTNTNATSTGQNKTLTYNLLNLPQTISFNGGTVTYTYDATGEKLRKQSPISGNTEYVGGIQYGSTITGLPDFIETDEGKAVPSGTSAYKYYYNLSDNLGNTRLTFDSSTGTTVTLQKDDYLPFGMEINRSVASPKNLRLYNNKELQEEIGQYDYGARFYDPIISRWNTPDPLAEKYCGSSPYSYALNNPIALIDPDGRDVIRNDDGSITFNNDGNEDAKAALRLLTGKTKNAYIDVERSSRVRKHINKVNNEMDFYGQWSVFSVQSIGLGLDALQALTKASGNLLDNLVVETHGGQGSDGDPSFQLDAGSGHGNDNYIYNTNLGLINGKDHTGNKIFDKVKAKVSILKSLGDLVTDGGNLLIAACNIGLGPGGQDFGRNLNKITGKRLNIFIPNGIVDEAIGRGHDNTYNEFILHSFRVSNPDGWLQTKPDGSQLYLNKIEMNLKNGPALEIINKPKK